MRFASVQVLRAVAALAVVFAHLDFEFIERFHVPNALPDLRIGLAGVDLFFVISGFVIVYSSEKLFERGASIQEFVRRRLIRILPLYWLATAVLVAWVLAAHSSFTSVKWSAGLVVASFFFWPYEVNGLSSPVVGPGWTLYFEMFFYTVFATTIWQSRERAVLWTTCVLLILLFIGALFPLQQPFLYWSNPIVLEFVFGMIIAILCRRGVRISAWQGATIALAGVASIIAAFILQNEFLVDRYIFIGVPCALIVGAAALAPDLPKSRFVATWVLLGDASYAIYLFHLYAFAMPRIFGLRPEGHIALYAIMIVVAAVAAGLSIHMLIERPLTAWLKRQSHTRSQISAASHLT